MATTDLESGEYHEFNRDNITFGVETANAAMSSGSIPGGFQPRPFQDHLYVDGGTIWNTNMSSAVKGCLSKGYTEEQIVVDVMICTASAPPDYDP